MKILYFHQHFSTPNGSTGTRSYEFAKKLIKSGNSVTMVCGSYWIAESGVSTPFKNGKRTGIVDGIKVIELDLNYSNNINFFKRSIIFLKYSLRGLKISLTEDYQVLFATSTPLTAGIPGIFAKIFRKKHFIFEVRDLWPELPKALGVIKNPILLYLMNILESITYYFSDICIGLSPGILDGIKKKSPNKPLFMIPNGCDLNLVQKKPFTLKKPFVAVFTGAHGYANGLDKVLDVIEVLNKQKRDDIQIQFIGDGIMKSRLKAEAKRKRLKNYLFLDPMPKNLLFEYIQKNASVGLMVLENIPAFYYGTSPNKFFDYLSLGLPVINNYPGWLSSLIRDNNCGIAVEPNNSELFSEALIKLKDNPGLLKEIANNCRALARNKFNRENLFNDFEKVFDTLINK